MRTNFFVPNRTFNHEGTKFQEVAPYQKLRRLTMASMLWEDTFYVDGQSAADLIKEVCQKVAPEKIVQLAKEVHAKGLLRHMPLFLIVEALKRKAKCSEAIYDICTRPDQMTELLSLYWKDGKRPIASQLKRGLAKAFTRFDAYSLAKYNRDAPIKLRDILFLCHAKPKDKEQEALWKQLISKTLPTPETWETKLSAGEDKKDSFEQLLLKGKMGKLAIIRNLRNMQQQGIHKELVASQLMSNKRVLLPFQFLAAARECPQWEDIIDPAMIMACEEKPKLLGKTVLLVDVSGSMDYALSQKGTMKRMDAACGMAILLREMCMDVTVYTFSNQLAVLPPRRGMALRDSIIHSQPHGGTDLGGALTGVIRHQAFDRIIVITDEQSQTPLPLVNGNKKYILNVGTFVNGIANHQSWLTINGFSEACIDYIYEVENDKAHEE